MVEYKITVENTGNTTLNNISIADTMSNGATVELSADTIATLEPSATATVTATYTVTQADVDKGVAINNVATATSDNGTTDPSEPAPFDPEAPNPGLQTAKTVTSTGSAEGGSYRVGDVVTYDITVKNIGNTTLNNIVITDTMSNGAAAELSADTIATLAPGASEKVTATYTVTQADVDANAVINNIATATAEGGTTDPSDPAPFTPENPNPGLRTVKTVTSTGTGAGGTYNAGDVATYEITVENTGNTTQNNIAITDTMTNGAAAGLSEDIIASLAPGETATVTATYIVTQADVDAGVVINNVATATSENGTTDPSDPAPITPNPPNPPTPPVTPPTPPVTPPATPPVTPPVTPPGTVPPDSPIAPVIAPVVEVLEDAVTPLAGPNETEIDDNGTPLANQEHPYCWVHFYLILGIIVTVIYGACVALRRSLFSRKLKKYEDNLTGGGDPAPGTTTGADDTVSIPKGVPATAAVGLGE